MNKDSNVRAEEIIIQDLNKNSFTILDYGCGEGRFTNKLMTKTNKVYGCDVDRKRIAKAKRKYKNIRFRVVPPFTHTPYKDGFFDRIILLGVLEHVRDEKETLKEIARILKPGGVLYIYGINKGILGFLDAANIKFRFPRFHKILYIRFNGRDSYNMEFGNKQKGEMFGDFTAGKDWHTHYSKNDLIQLTSKNFIMVDYWYYGLFEPILRVFEFVVSKLIKKKKAIFFWNLIVQDSYLSVGSLSYSFVAKCQRK